MDVYGTGDEEIGEIEEVLMDASGEPVAVAVEVGGFLGVGDTDAIVMFDRLTLSGDRFTTTMTKEQIETLPEWDDYTLTASVERRPRPGAVSPFRTDEPLCGSRVSR